MIAVSNRTACLVLASLVESSTSPLISVDLVAASYRSDTFPKDWSEEKRKATLARYEDWLRLKQRHLKAPLAPTADIDLFWHLHMLSPVAYHRDCMRNFGFLLDHDGGFGKGEGELPKLMQVFTQTARWFEEAFGRPYRDDGLKLEEAMTNCWHDCSARCWHACSEVSAEAAP